MTESRAVSWEALKAAAAAAAGAGGRLLLVGGQVRDGLAGGAAGAARSGLADFDLAAFGLPLEKLLGLFRQMGPAREISRHAAPDQLANSARVSPAELTRTARLDRRGGSSALAPGPARTKAPALVHLRAGGKIMEISPARRLEQGRARFSALATLHEDALTRDFTVNAIYYDPLTGLYEDPLGGRRDLAAGILRLCHPDSFALDPVRLLRAMAFISRFGFRPAPDLLAAADRPRPLLAAVPPDRFWPEWRKWAEGRWPHLGLEFLAGSGLINFWPALAALPGTPQNPVYHPEGDVWTHTVLVARSLAEAPLDPSLDRVVLMLAALLHDVGKPASTVMTAKGWASRGHAQAGAGLAVDFLNGLTAPQRIIKAVGKLVGRHMDLSSGPATPRAIRRLARRLAPELNLAEFHALCSADWLGRGQRQPYPLTLAEFLAPLGGGLEPPPPLLGGRDLLAAFPGLSPGPALGALLDKIQHAADGGLIQNRQEALDFAASLLGGGRPAQSAWEGGQQ